MKTDTRIAVLCNNRMALPAIQALQASGQLCAVGVPAKNEDVLPILRDLALQSGIVFSVFNKETLAADLDRWLSQSAATAVCLMTFPWRIPSETLRLLPDRFYNFHYGLLPEMRGADPVFECIRRQRTVSGITVHVADEGIDTGPVVLRREIPLPPDVTHGLLCTQLAYLGARMAPVLLQLLIAGDKAHLAGQQQEGGAYFTKPGLREVCIDWTVQSASDVDALVRACNPWNKGAYTHWNGWNMRIVGSSVSENVSDALPGTVVSADAQGIHVACKNNTLLKIEYIYTDEGFMPAHKLSAFGMKPLEKFSIF